MSVAGLVIGRQDKIGMAVDTKSVPEPEPFNRSQLDVPKLWVGIKDEPVASGIGIDCHQTPGRKRVFQGANQLLARDHAADHFIVGDLDLRWRRFTDHPSQKSGLAIEPARFLQSVKPGAIV